MKQVGEVASK